MANNSAEAILSRMALTTFIGWDAPCGARGEVERARPRVDHAAAIGGSSRGAAPACGPCRGPQARMAPSRGREAPEIGLDAGGAKGAESSIAGVIVPAGRGSRTRHLRRLKGRTDNANLCRARKLLRSGNSQHQGHP